MRTLVLAASSLLVLACTVAPDQPVDAGVTVDAGISVSDAGVERDGGSTLMADGGEDAGFDPATCPCTREILPAESSFNASALDAGTVVCFKSSTAASRGPLTVTGLNGTEANPILLRNCGGSVTFSSTTTSIPLSLSGTGFRVSGAGAQGVTRGLRFTGSNAPFLVYVGRASHFELDHLEVFNSAFAGISAKVDPSSTTCTVADRRYDPFVMTGVNIHHNFIHEMGGEGLYLGNSFYAGAGGRYCYAPTNATCDRSACPGATQQYPHELRHVKVHHNLIDTVGWDGIQVGSAVDDCVIEDNSVRNFGTLRQSSQNHGIQVGAGSSCRVERNLVRSGPKGLTLQGIGEIVVVNNVFVDFIEQGIEVNPRPTPLSTDFVDAGYRGGFVIAFNTLIAGADAGLVIADVNAAAVGDLTGQRNTLANNLVVFPAANWLRKTDSRFAWVTAGNQAFVDAAAAALVDAANDQFCVKSTASTVDAAATVYSVSSDFRQVARPRGAGNDIGAWECW